MITFSVEVVFTFVLGAVFGSFVNALSYRIENKMTLGGRSICPGCKHQLGVLDLVPVLSWVYLRGKCRYCHKPISMQYPIVEILSGFSSLALSYSLLPRVIPGQWPGIQSLVLSGNLANFLNLGFWFILISTLSTILILLALYDYQTGYVLSYYVYAAIFIAAILVIFPGFHFVGISASLLYLYSAIGGAAPFAFLWLISKGKWMGAGDIELAFLVGILLGWPAVVIGLYFAFIVGSIVGVSLVLAKKSGLKSQISFAPFLIAGIYFALLFSQQLVSLYARIFLG